MAHYREHERTSIVEALNPARQMKVMGRLVRRRAKKPGSAPGTLVSSGPQKVERVRVRFLDYDEKQLNDNEEASIDECLKLKKLPTVSWINIDGLHEVELIGRVGERFEWHPLVQEDIASPGQRAKIEEYEGHTFVTLPMLTWNVERKEVIEEQLSLVVGENYVFSFQERYGDVFNGVRERIRAGRTRIRSRGSDYLAYALIDAVVDHYFTVIEEIGEFTEVLDERVLADSSQDTMQVLHALKRELITLRRAMWPVREMLNSILRSETHLFDDSTKVFMRDVQDHTVQALDTIESLRDVVSGMVDLYLSMVSFRANEIMKVLTIMASIFIPLTFFAGIYGMNFEFMPELAVRWAYPALLLFMVVIGSGMVAFFRRKGWL